MGATPVAIPAGTPSGYYYLFARADGGSLVSETQEGNNGAIRSFTIGPDLIVSITSTRGRYWRERPPLVKDNVTNRGGRRSGTPRLLIYYLSTNYTLESGRSNACKPTRLMRWRLARRTRDRFRSRFRPARHRETTM